MSRHRKLEPREKRSPWARVESTSGWAMLHLAAFTLGWGLAEDWKSERFFARMIVIIAAFGAVSVIAAVVTAKESHVEGNDLTEDEE